MRISTPADDATHEVPARRGLAGAPVVIEARAVHKSFRIPEHRVDSLKERAAHPLRRIEHRELRALHDVSFDVRSGEFFGIVGRNGSGKSTLLKILASIYRADAGRIRIAGRVAPFIELGVGFNLELTARENGVLNGVLMGLSLREARRRLDAVLAFAELEEFVDLKLKNYSSGMLVRFAFAVMVQADADIMLIDEVLAVGDAAFAQKCLDVFHAKRRAGTTIVLVTHDMTTVQTLCHRAMLLDDGALRFIGEPEDAALRYYQLNFGREREAPAPGGTAGKVVDLNVRVVHARLEGGTGAIVERVEAGRPLSLDVLVEAARPMRRPSLRVQVRNHEGLVLIDFTRVLDAAVASGGRMRLRGQVENRLAPGRYTLDLYVREEGDDGGYTVQGLRLLQLAVDGERDGDGVMAVLADVDAELDERPA